MENANKSTFLCSATISSCCANPPNINSTALLDTAANISLLANGAPSERATAQLTPNQSCNQKETDFLPQKILSSSSTNSNQGMGSLLHPQKKPTTSFPLQLLQMQDVKSFFTRQDVKSPSMVISSCEESGNHIIPTPTNHSAIVVSSLSCSKQYLCKNTGQLINFYYATMGYPIISMWIKAIDKGYF
ncbi:hypothetical protein ACHAW6_011694 [Cyclotella cf. meneghiniana]